jgi:UDP-2,3-diacylglucosamine pyrophosphatase LpxH
MEGDTFSKHFGALPEVAARALEATLDAFNEARLEASHSRHIAVYRRFVDAMTDPPDLVICGHIHKTFDEVRPNGARLVVLGNWHKKSSYLRLGGGRAELIIEML